MGLFSKSKSTGSSSTDTRSSNYNIHEDSRRTCPSCGHSKHGNKPCYVLVDQEEGKQSRHPGRTCHSRTNGC